MITTGHWRSRSVAGRTAAATEVRAPRGVDHEQVDEPRDRAERLARGRRAPAGIPPRRRVPSTSATSASSCACACCGRVGVGVQRRGRRPARRRGRRARRPPGPQRDDHAVAWPGRLRHRPAQRCRRPAGAADPDDDRVAASRALTVAVPIGLRVIRSALADRTWPSARRCGTFDNGSAMSSSDWPSALTPKIERDDAADQHDAGTEEVADGQRAAGGAVADHQAVDGRAPASRRPGRWRRSTEIAWPRSSSGKISLTVR